MSAALGHTIFLENGGRVLGREQRRLAAIVAADVVGYSRLMGRDESGTLARLRAHRTDLIDPAIAAHGGRIVKTMGDGLLLEFPSAVDATRCIIEIQTAMAVRNANVPESERIVFRIGVNLGDIIIDGDDIHGDGVNVAARLQAEASAGGIVLAGAVHDAVSGRVQATFEDLGELALKNIERPVRAYRARLEGAAAPASVAVPTPTVIPLALPDKPSIAVLPFQNMSGDPEQEYFVDGMVEDIITALSRFKSLFVIARNSSFTYKGKAVDVRQVGRELGVRYVLEGSVRKASGKVRITGQLIDSETGAHLWADRYDGSLDDVFGLQDQITTGIVGALDLSINTAEILRVLRKPTVKLDAYDYFLRAVAKLRAFEAGQYTKDSLDEAEALFARATALDPDFASAYGIATWCHFARKARGWTRDEATAIAETERLAARTWEADKDDAYAVGIAGYALAYVARDLDRGHAWLERALASNPNMANVWAFAGMVKTFLGRYDEAVDHVMRAMRLSPRDPAVTMMRIVLAHAHYFAGRYTEAATWALTDLQETPNNAVALRVGAASLAMSGDLPEAGKLCARFMQVDPSRRLSNLAAVMGPYRNPEPLARYTEGLRRAGLPE